MTWSSQTHWVHTMQVHANARTRIPQAARELIRSYLGLYVGDSRVKSHPLATRGMQGFTRV